MVLLAGVLYVIHCQQINAEFGHNEEFFGQTFDEVYALSDIDGDIVDPLLAMGEDALKTIGTGEEFGLLERYCIDGYPEAVRAEAEIEAIAAGIEEDSGYLWVAYHQAAYDADDELVTASGTQDSRVLSRWSIEKIDGTWTVTEIKEKP